MKSIESVKEIQHVLRKQARNFTQKSDRHRISNATFKMNLRDEDGFQIRENAISASINGNLCHFYFNIIFTKAYKAVF